MNTKKVYLAHPISTKGEFTDSKRLAQEIRDIGYDVYAAAENNKINDKKNNPTPSDIYEGDVNEIVKCDLFVVNITGGLQDGTISEVGLVAGWNEAMADFLIDKPIPIFAYTSNARLQKPQFYQGISSAGANHLVLGMIDMWGEFYNSEEDLLKGLAGYYAHIKNDLN